MSKKTGRIVIGGLFVVLALPSLLYFVVNIYWWLFGNNVLDVDKLGASLILMFVGTSFRVLAFMVNEEVL